MKPHTPNFVPSNIQNLSANMGGKSADLLVDKKKDDLLNSGLILPIVAIISGNAYRQFTRNGITSSIIYIYIPTHSIVNTLKYK